MKIAFLTPGAGEMYCGGCLHDKTLVNALNKLGHNAILLPLYLPLKLDEPESNEQYPIFYNGISVYLDQKSALFRHAPKFLRNLLSVKPLVKLASRFSSYTDPQEVGEIAVSMLQGEDGRQNRELNELVDWLEKKFKPDVVCLSNSMLLGVAKKIYERLKCAVVCQFQGEDSYINAMPTVYRSRVWRMLDERVKDAHLFIAPSQYALEAMRCRLVIPEEKVRVVYNGIDVDEFQKGVSTDSTRAPTVLGYFARMCEEKGLHLLIEAYIELKNYKWHKDLKLKIGGSCLKRDERYIRILKDKLKYAGVLNDVEFFPNVGKQEKIAFYQSIDIFSVPAVMSEAFGLYTIEAMAAGVPLVLPHHGSFVEIVKDTNTGILYAPNFTQHLVEALDKMLSNNGLYRSCKESCLKTARERYDSSIMAKNFINAIKPLVS